MNPRSSEQQPAPQQTEDPSFLDSMDLIRECADLQGTFPENVELKFVFWTHETAEDIETSSEKMTRVAPHFLDADLICLEITESPQANPAKDVSTEFDIVNRYIHGLIDRDELSQEYHEQGIWVTNAYTHATVVADALETMDASKKPLFGPIDIYADQDYVQFMDAEIKTYEEFVARHVAETLYRESTVLRQLNIYANYLARDTKAQQIAVLYGARHSLIAAAARVLGAPTSRVFVNKPMVSPHNYLTSRLRFEIDEQTKQIETKKAQKAYNMSCVIPTEPLIPNLPENEGRLPPILAAKTRGEFGMLCLRSLQGTLTGAQAHALRYNFTAVLPRNKRAIKKLKRDNEYIDPSQATAALAELIQEARRY
jgi:hypothetical protein